MSGWQKCGANTPGCIQNQAVITVDQSEQQFSGVAHLDGALNPARDYYIMYTEEPVTTRFTSPHPSNTENFIGVYWDGTNWFNENSSLGQPEDQITIQPTDLLITQVLSPGIATPFPSDGVTNSIPHVANSGGLIVVHNSFNGTANGGEFDVTGVLNATSQTIENARLQMDGTYLTDGGDTLTVKEVIAEGYVPCTPDAEYNTPSCVIGARTALEANFGTGLNSTVVVSEWNTGANFPITEGYYHISLDPDAVGVAGTVIDPDEGEVIDVYLVGYSSDGVSGVPNTNGQMSTIKWEITRTNGDLVATAVERGIETPFTAADFTSTVYNDINVIALQNYDGDTFLNGAGFDQITASGEKYILQMDGSYLSEDGLTSLTVDEAIALGLEPCPVVVDMFGVVVQTATAAFTTSNGVPIAIGESYIEFPNGDTWDAPTAAPAPLVTTSTVYSEEYFARTADGTTSPAANNRQMTMTRTALGQWDVVLNPAHPDGVDYHASITAEEQSANRDTPDITIVQGSQTANGFSLQITTGDNGGAVDSYVDTPFTIGIDAPVQVVTGVA